MDTDNRRYVLLSKIYLYVSEGLLYDESSCDSSFLFSRPTSQVAACRHLATAVRVFDFTLVFLYIFFINIFNVMC